ncbi:glutamine synthetase [Bradyrhizobium sp. USDA 326]
MGAHVDGGDNDAVIAAHRNRERGPPLPKSLRDAVAGLKDDPFFRDKLGAEFVDYYTHIKNTEIDRLLSEVTDWEHREYFDVL